LLHAFSEERFTGMKTSEAVDQGPWKETRGPMVSFSFDLSDKCFIIDKNERIIEMPLGRKPKADFLVDLSVNLFHFLSNNTSIFYSLLVLSWILDF
jgi:hypothetical protein